MYSYTLALVGMSALEAKRKEPMDKPRWSRSKMTRKRHQCFGLSFPRRLPTDERAMAEASRYGAAKSS